ncbi:unnamed protein product [Gongylonema pulchrum]|uniref:Glutamyl-tRNA(Gln) amidotransferase subunit C, mitochondrial n=1 Tax=Gongylonema pulchrum TaxID=637853 RepID=A0A183EWF5_9BILA|nr:unnamed protein product [Gongylonema pulchrum]
MFPFLLNPVHSAYTILGIEPLETLLEDVPCPLREDVVDDMLTKEEVLMNAAKTVEDYFVTPPGNIPLEESDRLDLEKVEDWDRKAMENRTRWHTC